MNKQMFGVIKRALVALVVVILICFLPYVKIYGDENFDMIFKAFVGAKGKYQGVLVVWNIDDFESGTSAKSNYLTSIAKKYEKSNKGTYVLIRNMTQYECLSLLESGERPDLFSCSHSFASELEKYAISFDDTKGIGINKNLFESGKKGDEFFALAYARGIYVLLSTTDNLTRAGKSLENGKKLSSIALSSGYEYTKNKKTKVVSSLVFGTNGKLLPQNAFSSYTGIGLESSSALEVNEKSFNQSQYSAYALFVAGESSILLGTQRDVARMEGRLASGKISDILYEPLTCECDLVQYVMLANTGDKLRSECAKSYAKMLASSESQQNISHIGMLSVIDELNPYKSGIMFDIASENFSDYKVLSVFG